MEFAVLAILSALVTVSLAGLVYVVAAGHRYRDERRTWNSLTARRVVVNLKAGSAVDGILVERSGDVLRIREAVLHSPGSDNPAPIDGELIVLRGEVEYLQYPTTE